MKTRIAKDGCWLTYTEEKPIGQWEWFLRVDCPDSVDVDNYYKDIPNAEKESKEKEQEDWRKEQEEE